MLVQLERLWNLCESTLLSSFKHLAINDDEVELTFDFADDLRDPNPFR